MSNALDPQIQYSVGRGTALSRVLHFENAMHRRLGMVRGQRYTRLYNYYTNQNLPPDNVDMPLGINFIKPICDKHAHYLWGQWNRDIVAIKVTPREKAQKEDGASQKIQDILTHVLDDNRKNTLLYDLGLNAEVYGDGILRAYWDGDAGRVVVENVLPEWFHARWQITNMDRLTEVITAYPISRDDAQAEYGTSGNTAVDYTSVNPGFTPGFGILWEHWTPTTFRRWIDDHVISDKPNPFMRTGPDEGVVYPGVIPYIHVPNMRVGGEFWGFSIVEGILGIQDEINRRMADMGDTVNNHAHPIIGLRKFGGKSDDLPVGPDAIWDLGREGEVEVIQWEGTPPAVMAYIDKCMQVMYDTSSMPESAFGRRGGGGGGRGGNSGGGASGIALQMALMPIVEHAIARRVHFGPAIVDLCDLIYFILSLFSPDDLPCTYEEYKANYVTTAEFAPVLPRDRLALVNEVVARSNALLQSIPSALEDLGEEDILDEYKAIQKDARFKAALGIMTPPVPGGKNSDRGNGGSNAHPGGPGAQQRKAGAGAKDA